LLFVTFTCFHSTEIRYFAFETQIVWAHMFGISQQVFMTFTYKVNFIKSFCFSPLNWLLLNHLFDINGVINHGLDFGIISCLHSYLTLHTIQKLQNNPRCRPAIFKNFF
jgi:hypothetical protein